MGVKYHVLVYLLIEFHRLFNILVHFSCLYRNICSDIRRDDRRGQNMDATARSG